MRAYTVKLGTLSTTRSANGTLEATTDSNVAAQASGQVVQILKREGDKVQKGEIIVRLDDTSLTQQLANAQLSLQNAQVSLRQSANQTPETLSTQQARLNASRIALQRAEQTLASNQRLYDLGGISQTDLQNSRSQVESARADLEQAEANLAQTQRAGSETLESRRIAVAQAQNQLDQLQTSLSRTAVRAPFAGEIGEIYPNLGEYINTGSRVFRLVDSSSLRVNMTVSPSDASSLMVGSGLTYTIAGKRYEGRVYRSAQVAGDNRLVQLYGRFVGGQNTSGLTSGSSVQVTYRIRQANGVLAPTGALQTSEGQSYVFVIEGDTLKRQSVRILAESSGQVALQGLGANARIVFPLPGGLQSGQKVTVVGGQ